MDSEMVFPGSTLGTEEEYTAGKNASISDNGNVIACVAGKADLDNKERKISILKQGKNALPFEAGDTVFGKISLVKENSAMLEIAEAYHNGEQRVILRGIASIMIRMVDQGFVRNLSDKFRIGDIVKARIVGAFPYGIDCSTTEKEFGVVKAFCRRCRQPLHLFGMELKCLSCGSMETRKISSDYILK